MALDSRTWRWSRTQAVNLAAARVSRRAARRGPPQRGASARAPAAAPVVARPTAQALRGEAGEVVCILEPDRFFAVGCANAEALSARPMLTARRCARRTSRVPRAAVGATRSPADVAGRPGAARAARPPIGPAHVLDGRRSSAAE